MDPITGNPRPRKIYYDIATFFGTQLTFAFAVSPFLVLSFSGSIKVWGRVYFYALLWTFATFGFFLSPGKAWLKKQLEQRQGRASARLVRTVSTESLTGGHPILGISTDPEGDVTEAIQEIRAEIEKKKRAEESKAKKKA